jgi:XTP/dITP diphosphohydrolase
MIENSRLKLLLATNNRGKVEEYRSLLQDLPVRLVTPVEIGISLDIDESGSTYEDNARLKAETLAKASNIVSLADDSGLEVDFLGGEPGIRSARYAGEVASDADRVKFLLNKLQGVPWNRRTARFRCVIALAVPDGRTGFCSGICEGIIALAPQGNLGFGYDPVFYFPELDRTMAELTMEIKNSVSHRGRAAAQVPEALKKLGVVISTQ